MLSETNCSSTASAWATEEFRSLDLSHKRREDRLRLMAAAVAQRPAGTIAECIALGCEREGAYRLIEGGFCSQAALVDASADAAFLRGVGLPHILVPMDGSSGTFRDSKGIRELGPVGRSDKGARGLQTMDGVALTPQGAVLGLVHLEWWRRPDRKRSMRSTRLKGVPFEEKEPFHQLDGLEQIYRRWKNSGVESPLWFQLDRGNDIREELEWAVAHPDVFTTIRAAYDRRLSGENTSKLKAALRRQRVVTYKDVNVPAGKERKARRARLAIRSARVRLRFAATGGRRAGTLPINVVWVKEEHTCSGDETPIEWVLLTTAAEVCATVDAYALRWRIEDFHKTWKSICKMESTQLRKRAAIEVWATLLAAVATRVENLKTLSRTEPDAPAETLMSKAEIAAITLLWKPDLYGKYQPTISEAVMWLAELGGYAGKHARTPPGSKTIARGLDRIQLAVVAVEKLAPK